MTAGAVLMLLAGAAVVGIQTAVGQLNNAIQVSHEDLGDAGKKPAEVESGHALDGAIDLLLLGIDIRASQEDKNDTRADSILLLHIPASHNEAYLMSIPRDTVVSIPPWKKTKFTGSREKINSAFMYGARHGSGWDGGMALMALTVHNLTGITFDGVAVIDFSGFQRIINTLGTVNICVDTDADSLHYYLVKGVPTYVNEDEAKDRRLVPYLHKKGCRDMAGWEALDYSRIRKSLDDGDYGRQRHQQQLIKAMAKKAASKQILTDGAKLSELLSAAGTAMRLNTNGVPLEDFLFTMKDLAGTDLVLLKTNNGDFNSPDGGSSERLDDNSMAMFAAAKRDALGPFVLMNPDFVNNEQ